MKGVQGWEPHLCGGSPTILLVTSTITFGLSRDYLKFFNYSAPQNVLFNYNSLSINNFLSDPVQTS